MNAQTLADDLHRLAVETFEVEDLPGLDMFAADTIVPFENDAGFGCCSCSCSSTCSCSTSSTCSCSCSTGSTSSCGA